jgi:hypothetical protein
MTAYNVRCFGTVQSEDPWDAVDAFIEMINTVGLRNLTFFVDDTTVLPDGQVKPGQTWVINTGNVSPRYVTLEKYHADQQRVGLGAPEPQPEPDAEDEHGGPSPEVAPPAAVQPKRRAPRKRPAEQPPAPPVDQPIAADAGQAVRDRIELRRQGC